MPNQPTSTDVLNFLKNKEEQRFRSWQIADRFQIRTKDATPILTKLEQMGFVKSCVIGKNRFFYMQSEAQKTMACTTLNARLIRPLVYYDDMLRLSFPRR